MFARRQSGLNGVLFLSSFCIMVIEIVAGRILAPFLGVSLYTWTSIIGVVLAGISIGAWLGGLVADRYPRASTLGWILLLSSATALSVSPIVDLLGRTFLVGNLMGRILLVTALVFLIPSCLLGTVSPVAVRLALVDVETTGSVAGKMYAISTIGSILGTFATGFWLISLLGTRDLLFLVGIVLLLAGLLYLGLTRVTWIAAVAVLPFVLWPVHHYLYSPKLDSDVVFFKESNYFTIKVIRSGGSPPDRLVTLYLDQLTHSRSDLDDPSNLQYRYIRSYREILQWKLNGKMEFATLSLGGGGYTFPRFIEASYPGTKIDVVEIDPMITRVAREYMGVSPVSRIRTINQDGRWFVMNARGEAIYDFIFLDAFNDLSIPYHLTTREFAAGLKRLLKKDGILVVNVIDRFEKGSFLPAYIRTLEEVFGKGRVDLVTLGEADPKGVDNRVVVANLKEDEAGKFASRLAGLETADRISYVMPSGRLQHYLAEFDPVVLTDDYVPVDNLTARNFR